jgi:hypothetical protein
VSNEFNRRLFLERGALVGTGASLFPLTLAGCGTEDAQGDSGLRILKKPLPAPVPPASAAPAAARTGWRVWRIGAGGFLTGMDIADDGTMVVRTDTYGAYIWNETAAEWQQLMTRTSMPMGDFGHENDTQTGVYEIVIAPSDSNRIYLAINGFVFKSTDRGQSFTRTALAKTVMDPNDNFRVMGRRMAVDPFNPDVLYFGTPKAGLMVTTDGGAVWINQGDIPLSTTDAGILISFDLSAGKTGNRAKGIYVASGGRGVFTSRNAGASFAAVPGAPITHDHMVCGQNGVLWITDSAITSNNTWRFVNGSWKLLNGMGWPYWHSIAIDPKDPDHVVLGSSGDLCVTKDGGATWTDNISLNSPKGAVVRVATDIPWLAWTSEDYMSHGDMRFDPKGTNRLMFAEGIGVWYTNPPSTWSPFTWTSQSRGIEQLVAQDIVVPPGGSPLFFCQDRGVFKSDDPEKYPAVHGPGRKHSIIMGWSGDYSLQDPKFVVGLVNYWGKDESAYSVDGGSNWTKFASVPAEVTAGKIGGSIAVSTPDNIIWVPNNNANPWVTKNRGVSWQQISIPGVPTSGETGWGWAFFLVRQIVAADRVNAGTFYMYNYLRSSVGLYRSTDGGTNWERVYANEIGTGSTYNAKLEAVPGKKGHLFFTAGWQSGSNPSGTQFFRSTDGGASWTALDKILEVYSFGFGKAAPGQDYPAIFIAGYVDNVWGLWRSDDDAASWVKIGDYPLGNVDIIRSVAGDMDRYGRCYVGFAGAGGAYADLVA